MTTMTFGQMMLSRIFPPGIYEPGTPINKKQLSDMLGRVAQQYPDRYDEVASGLVKFGLSTGESMGGASFGLEDLMPSDTVKARQQSIQLAMKKILDESQGPARKTRILELLQRESEEVPELVYQDGVSRKNRFTLQLEGAGRGNKKSLASMLAGDILVQNSSGDPIPVPITRGYSQGQTLGQYFATAYGGRSGIVATKLSVGASGYLGKLLQQAAHRLVVVGDDDDEQDPTEQRGLLVDAADPDNVGALLARDIGPFNRNTPITPSMLNTLHRLGDGKVLVRSPIASSSLSGGVYARDVGVREFGRLPRRGEHVGNPASQAISEQVTQSSLSAKHSGGAAGAANRTPGLAGFSLVERLVNPPKEGRGLAIHAQRDGNVTEIREAPQGGRYVMVGDTEHYVAQEFTPSVKVGDSVDAGDSLTDGIADPSEAVRHKGIGEGRRYFVDSLRRGLKEAGFPVDRRNLELLSRGLIDRVQIDQEFGDFTPGSVVSYSRVERLYRPRKDSQRTPVDAATGRYLERPALHYTIGTRVTPRVVKELKQGGVGELVSHTAPPPFTGVAVRAADILQTDPDYMTQFFGSHLQKNLLRAAQQGGESDENSTSFVPLRAHGLNLGRPGLLLSGS